MSSQVVRQFVTKYNESLGFKILTFFVCVFLIVVGSMLVYESQSASDSEMNTGLIAVGGIMLFLTLVMLCALIWIVKKTDLGLPYEYVLMVVVVFGVIVGTISIINGVDVPNSSSRSTLGWVFGGITTGVGVIATLIYLAHVTRPYWTNSWDKTRETSKKLDEE